MGLFKLFLRYSSYYLTEHNKKKVVDEQIIQLYKGMKKTPNKQTKQQQ